MLANKLNYSVKKKINNLFLVKQIKTKTINHQYRTKSHHNLNHKHFHQVKLDLHLKSRMVLILNKSLFKELELKIKHKLIQVI
jgi:hypothetical protein